jgi:pimeloyl-ACP methyl ester carboxylesterase
LERWRSFPAMIRVGWGGDNPAFRQLFTSLFMPDGDDLSMRFFNHMQEVAATPEDAARFIEAMIETDATGLAPRLDLPVLVVHVRGDQIVPYGLGRELASLAPGARLVTLEGNNHMIFEIDPGFDALQETLGEFFDADLTEAGG